ncbi:hypothetical protein CRYUN_Cryun36dG0095500 [Craigia yunnanensis]
MASYRAYNQNDGLANIAADGFRLLDEIRPPPGRRAGMGRAPPQYPHEIPYHQQPWMWFRNQAIYPRDQCYVITSAEAAQMYGGTLLNDLPKGKLIKNQAPELSN